MMAEESRRAALPPCDSLALIHIERETSLKGRADPVPLGSLVLTRFLHEITHVCYESESDFSRFL